MALTIVVTVVLMINLLYVTGQEEVLVDQLECYSDRILGCSGTPVLGVSSPRDCCLGDGYWYRLGPSRECMQCIVHGFEQSVFVSEEGSRLSIPVRLNQKGNQVFSRSQRMIVHGMPETAGSSDYRLETTGFRLADDLHHIIVQLKRDHIALEGNETFRLELEVLFDLDINEFLKNSSSITITDTTRFTPLAFAEADYAAEEGNGVLNVTLQRISNNPLASDLVLRITPLTFEEAEKRGFPPYSRVLASAKRQDYNNSPPVEIVLTGFSLVSSFFAVSIPITDDEINEPEEGFLLVLELVSAVDPSLVDLSARNASICRIQDNDRISIGFLKGEYTFSEEGDTHHTVTVTKNRPTEQTFFISTIIQRQSGLKAAVVGKDMSVDNRDHSFRPDEDSLTVVFEIFDDAIPEGTEAFQIISSGISHEKNPDFDCDVAEGCFTSTLIVIYDNDELTVGFETTEIIVSESSGEVMLCVNVTEPANELIELEFYLEANMYPGTAGLDDFALPTTVLLERFSETLRRQCFSLAILDDYIAEGTEMGTVTLQLAIGDIYPQVRINPASTTITIIDDEYVIGFEHDAYTVSEEDGSVEVCAGFISGTSKKPIHIILTTVDGRATDPTDYTSTTRSQEINSTLGIPSCMAIPVINDETPEIHEDFRVTLSLREDDPHAVFSSQNITITITDDDVEAEPEKGCTIEVFVQATQQEEMQMMVVQSVQTVLPNIFGIPLPTTEAPTDNPDESTTTATVGSGETETTTATPTNFTSTIETPTPSPVRKDPVLSMVYSTLAEKFDKVDSDTGYTQFVEAVTEVTEAHQEACSGQSDEQPTHDDVPRLAQQFATLPLNESKELRSIFGKMLCLRDRHSDRKKRQVPVPVDICDGIECPDGEFDSVTDACEFFACLDNETEGKIGMKLEAVFGFVRDDLQCLAFVVDTTGSMRNEIAAVRDLIFAYVSSEEPGCYIITPFNDNHGYYDYPDSYDFETPPNLDYGPATAYDAFDEDDLLNMRDDIDNLMAHGGGDGPEFGMNGLNITLQKKWPEELGGYDVMTEWSQIILFTDAPAKDAEIMMDVITDACQRKVCIHLFLSTYSTGGFDNYVTVAEETGGTIVRATATEFHDLVRIFGDFSTSYNGRSPCRTFYDTKRERGRRSSGEQCHTFKVSTFTSVLKLLITTEQLQTIVQKPSGARITNSTIRGYGGYREVHPEPGEWSVCVERGTLSVSFNNRVLLDFLVTFVKEDESSQTRIVTSTVPPRACSTANVSIISSNIADIALAHLNFVKDGDVIASSPLTSCSKAMVGTTTVPLGSFTYQLQGEDTGGNPFQVSGRTVNIKPGQYSLKSVSSTTTKLRSGESAVLVFELQNQNSYGSTEFTITSDMPSDFSVELQKTFAVLKAGESTQISAKVSADSLPHVTNDITITVNDGCTTVSAVHTLIIVPLDFDTEYAGGSICSNSTITTSSIPSACSSSDFAVFISKPIPGISVTHLSFVQNSRTIARTLLDSCSEIGALVGNATFPLGLVIYQLQGRGAEDKQFTYDSAAVEFRPGKYAFTTLSSVAELRQGESTVLVFELHNQNSYGSTEFAIHVEPTPDFFVAIQPSHALLEAGDSIQISIQVFANSLPGISTDIRVMAYDGCTTVTGTHTLAIVPLDFVVMYAEGDICATSNMTTSILPSACSSSDFAVFIPKPIPGISLTQLSFVQYSRTASRNPLSPCDTGVLVGNATFPLGLTTYQLQGKDVKNNTFLYESAAVEFRPGAYALNAVSTTEEVEAGDFVLILFELHNNILYGSTHFSFSTEDDRGLSAVPLQTTAVLEAGGSAEITVRVSAGTSSVSQTKHFTLTANDGCTSVSASHTLSITAPEIPTAEPDLCGCENGGTCVTIRRGRRTFHVCRCPSEYGGSRCQIDYNK